MCDRNLSIYMHVVLFEPSLNVRVRLIYFGDTDIS
jgi:hypothetical protein